MKSRLSGKRLLCLWLPNWPIQRLRVTTSNSGEALNRPVILWGNDPRRGRLVVATCAQASMWGVRPGMPLSQAFGLSEGHEKSTADDAHPGSSQPPSAPPQTDAIQSPAWIAPHDGQADQEALQELAYQCSGQLSPHVAIEPLDNDLWAGQTLHQPQSLFLDVTGIGTLFGGEPYLLEATIGFLESLGYEGRLAIADTAGTAWAVAHYEPPAATRLCPTDVHFRMPAWIVPSGQQAIALQPLRVAALRVSRDTTSTLRRLGIETIAALQKLPRSGLASRLNPHLLQRLDEALGDRDEPLTFHHMPPCSQTTIELEYPTADREILAHRLDVACQTLAPPLRNQQRGALQILCRFQTTEHQFIFWRLGFFTPTADIDHWKRLLHGHLQRQTFPAPIQSFSLSVALTGPLETRQQTLLDLGNETHSLRDWAKLIDTLSERLGRERVLGISKTDHPLPENAFVFQPLTGQPPGTLVPGRPTPKSHSKKRKASHPRNPSYRRPQHSFTNSINYPSRDQQSITDKHPFRRPIRLLPQPQPLSLDDAEMAPDTPPLKLFHGGRWHKRARWWGPERLETGWWHGPLQRRDYFRIELETGQWWWIFHDLRRKTWWLQGLFS